MAPTPWTIEKRDAIKRRIDKEAARAAGRLGADSVTIIAFFRDGDYLHMQDGGASPMPRHELYQKLAGAKDILAASGGKDVEIQ